MFNTKQINSIGDLSGGSFWALKEIEHAADMWFSFALVDEAGEL